MEKDFQFNGSSLITPRWNIEYVPEGIPKKRGLNIRERWTAKNYDMRTDILNMWIMPFNASGTLSEGLTQKEQVEINVEYLKQLFGISGLVQVRKKMLDGTWRKAYAEVVNTIEFKRKVETGSQKIFSVELQYPDPFCYGETEEVKEITPSAKEYSFLIQQ